MSTEKLTVKDVLKILATTSLVASSVAFPNLAIAYDFLTREWRKYKRGDIGIVVRRLYKQDLVRMTEKDGKTVIELSEKGKNKLLQYDFHDLNLNKRRDGRLRIVIFDIPNTHRIARDMFRDKLKELGFIKIQESVFLIPYICHDEIEFIINFLGIKDYVMLFQIGKNEIGPKFEFKGK